MRTYIKSLEQETEARIRKIEKTIQMPERSRLIAEVMENAFIKLKEFIIGYLLQGRKAASILPVDFLPQGLQYRIKSSGRYT